MAPPILLLFVFWLALHGKLKTYADFATTGPGIPWPNLAGAIVPPKATANPVQSGTGNTILDFLNKIFPNLIPPLAAPPKPVGK